MKKSLIILLTLLLLFVGCSEIGAPSDVSAGATVAQTTATTQAPSEGQSSQGQTSQEEPSAQGFNYLTGEHNLPGDMADMRPVAFMVNNLKDALPQYGVGSADIVYEMPVEGGITRLLALFANHQAITRVGSIRSARHNFLDIAAPYNAVFVHMGTSIFAADAIAARGLDNINAIYAGYAVFQDTSLLGSRGREHTFFVSQETLQAAFTNLGTDLHNLNQPAFVFAAEGGNAVDGVDCTHVDIRYSRYTQATFDYDAASQTYLKGEYQAPQMDANTGEQIGVTNVMVLFTDVHVISEQTAGLVEIALDSGEGYYFSKGKIMPVLWEKGAYTDPLRLKNADGSEVKVNAGQSWICVVPTAQKGYFSYN